MRWCHKEFLRSSAEQRDARSRRIYAERFICVGPSQMNRFALIPPLRALAGAPGRDDKKRLLCKDEAATAFSVTGH